MTSYEKLGDGICIKILDRSLCKTYQKRLNIFFGLNPNFSKFPGVLPRSLNKTNWDILFPSDSGKNEWENNKLMDLSDDANIVADVDANIVTDQSLSSNIDCKRENQSHSKNQSCDKTKKQNQSDDEIKNQGKNKEVRPYTKPAESKNEENKNKCIDLTDPRLVIEQEETNKLFQRPDGKITTTPYIRLNDFNSPYTLPKKEWYVTRKSDGVRYILMFDYNNIESYTGEIQVLFDRAMKQRFIKLKVPQWFYHGTVLEGELVREFDGTYVFYLFEIVYCNGYTTSNYSIEDRKLLMDKLVSYIKTSTGTRESPFIVKTKKWAPLKSLKKFIIEERLEYLLHGTSSSGGINHPCDGLILQEKNRGVARGSDPNVFKIKLVHTSDLLCRITVKRIDEKRIDEKRIDEKRKSIGICELFAKDDSGLIKICTQSIEETFGNVMSASINSQFFSSSPLSSSFSLSSSLPSSSSSSLASSSSWSSLVSSSSSPASSSSPFSASSSSFSSASSSPSSLSSVGTSASLFFSSSSFSSPSSSSLTKLESNNAPAISSALFTTSTLSTTVTLSSTPALTAMPTLSLTTAPTLSPTPTSTTSELFSMPALTATPTATATPTPTPRNREQSITPTIESKKNKNVISSSNSLDNILDLYNGKVGEFSRKGKKIWQAIKPRYPEKRWPNHIHVVENDMESEDNPITVSDLIELAKSMD